MYNKFSTTELEKAGEEYPDLDKHGFDETEALTQQEYLVVVKRMKNGKKTGPVRGIEKLTRELYFFLQALW